MSNYIGINKLIKLYDDGELILDTHLVERISVYLHPKRFLKEVGYNKPKPPTEKEKRGICFPNLSVDRKRMFRMKQHEIAANNMDLAEGIIEPPLQEELKVPSSIGAPNNEHFYNQANEEINQLIDAKCDAILHTRATMPADEGWTPFTFRRQN